MAVHGSGERTFELATTAMSTAVSVQMVHAPSDARALAEEAIRWFGLLEAACSRFDAQSELSVLMQTVGVPCEVSPLLFEVLRLALAMAEASSGAFDPCVGHHMHALGFDRHWQSGARATALPPSPTGTWRDIILSDGTAASGPRVLLKRPVHLDVNAIAKGFALDLAARTLAAVPHLCVYAGGDLICRGHNAAGQRWRTGIVDPQVPTRLAARLAVHHTGDVAVCTSGDYARITPRGHHLVDPGTGASAHRLRSVTVVAPQAAVADGLATAVFVMGAAAGATLLRDQGADGLLIDPSGALTTVDGWGVSEWEFMTTTVS